jgi:hypothetical protein
VSNRTGMVIGAVLAYGSVVFLLIVGGAQVLLHGRAELWACYLAMGMLWVGGPLFMACYDREYPLR